MLRYLIDHRYGVDCGLSYLHKSDERDFCGSILGPSILAKPYFLKLLMIKSKKKLFGNLFRGFLFGWFLLATAFVCLWVLLPEQVNRIDGWILNLYTQGVTKRFADCQEIIKKADMSATACLEKLLREDLAAIKKEDRLARLKREVLMATVTYYSKNKDFNSADYALDTWIAFDGRDLTAKVSRAQVYIYFPEKRQEGLRLLSELNSKYPDVKMITEAYQEALALTKRFSIQ